MQADLNFTWAHMSEVTFSEVEAQFSFHMILSRLKETNTSTWGPCTVSCETGVQEQLLTCVQVSNDDTEEEVALSNCKSLNHTITTRECHMGPCSFLEWGAGDWSKVIIRTDFLLYIH